MSRANSALPYKFSPSNSIIDLTPKNPSEIVATARKIFNDGTTRDVKFRKRQLTNILRFLEEQEESIIDALSKDLHKPKHEVIMAEIETSANEIRNAIINIDNWAKPDSPDKPLVALIDDLKIYKEPFGVVLIIGAWNYPVQLVLSPLTGAIAAGNCAVIKPSDLASHTAQLLNDCLPKYIDPECYPVYLGGVPETTALLEQRFDFIFYTGSTEVGRIIHRAANRFLTPTVLELGGKSPVYIDIDQIDIEKTVQRVLWGKFVNAGQTCIAPDYILCTKEIQEGFIKSSVKILKEFYGDLVEKSPDYCRIITERHFNRLVGLIDGLKIAVGGEYDAKSRYIAPTIAYDVSPNHPIMHEEIFGPILPIIPIRDIGEAISFINHREKPLALYIFTKSPRTWQLFLNKTSSGGVTINDTMKHAVMETLPFGGVGNSGMGAYHGKHTFDCFTHKRSVYIKRNGGVLDKTAAMLYPPYSEQRTRTLRKILKKRRGIPTVYFVYVLIFVIGFFSARIIC